MVFTTDMNVFVENMRKEKARHFWNDTKKCQRFHTPSPPVSPPVSPTVSPVNSVSKSLKRAKPEDFKVGQIVQYTHFKTQKYCEILKITPSKKSFKKRDCIFKDGQYVPTMIPNETNKDRLNTCRVLYIVA